MCCSKNQIFEVNSINVLQVFDPLFNPYVGSYSIGTYFSQVLFEWWCLESKIIILQHLCSSFLELEDERIQMPLHSIRIRLPGIQMFLSASRYPVILVSCFAIFSMFSSFFQFDSLYSFPKTFLMLLGMNSEHYIKFVIILFWVFGFCSLLFMIFELQASEISLPISG